MRNPDQLRVIASLALDRDVWDMQVVGTPQGSLLYLAEWDSLAIVELAGSELTLRARRAMPARAITLVESTAYVVGDASSSLQSLVQAFDLTNPLQPTLRGTYTSPSRISDLVASGAYGYAIGNGVELFDLRNRWNVLPVGQAASRANGHSSPLAASGSLVYVANAGLQVLQANPQGFRSYSPRAYLPLMRPGR